MIKFIIMFVLLFTVTVRAVDTYPVCGLEGTRDLPINRDKWADSSRFKFVPIAVDFTVYLDSFIFADTTYASTYFSGADATVAEITAGMVSSINSNPELGDSVTAEDSTTFYVVRPQRINTWNDATADANQTVTDNRVVDTFRVVVHIFGDDDSTGIPIKFEPADTAGITAEFNALFDTASIYWLVEYNYIYSTLLNSESDNLSSRQISAIAPDSQLNIWIHSGVSSAVFDTTLLRKNVLAINDIVTSPGETMAHETGHFLSLLHTGISASGGVCDSCYEYPIAFGQNDSMRNRTGDGIEDTPPDMNTGAYAINMADSNNVSSYKPDTCSDLQWTNRFPVENDTVQASTDDGSKSPTGWNTNGTIAYFGADDTTYIAAARFPNVQADSGDSVPYMLMSFLSNDVGTNSGEIVVDVKAQRLSGGDPIGAVLSTFADLQARSWTTATATMVITTTNWPLADNVRYDFDGFRVITQEAFAQVEWDAGDALIYRFTSRDSSDGVIKFSTYDDDPDDGLFGLIVTVDTLVNDYNYLNLESSPRRDPGDESFSTQQGWRIWEWLNGPFGGWKVN